MDNFKRYRPIQSRNQAIDGFVKPGTGRRRRPVSGTSKRQSSSFQRKGGLPTQRLIGDFDAPDGFRPINRNTQRTLHENLQEVSTDAQTARPTGRRSKPQQTSPAKTHAKPARQRTKKRRLTRLRQFLFFNPFRRQNWTKKRAFAHVFLCIILVGGFLGGKFWLNLRNILQGGGGAVALQENVDPSLLRGEGDGRVNILLLGRGGEGHDGPDLTDTIVIASINPIQKEAALLSIPRDLYVRSGNGSYTKINAVFANAKNLSLSTSSLSGDDRKKAAEDAGFKAIEQVISDKIGLPIHYHAIVDFAGFRKAINTVGGIDINITKELAVYEWFGPNSILDVKPGMQHFDGERALGFARSRKTSTRGDFNRSERQRAVIVALKDKVMSAGTYSNPWKISQLMSDFGGHVRTNLSVDEVKRLYDIGKDIPSNRVASVDLVTAPNDYIIGTMMNGLSVQIPKAGLDDYSDVKHFVRNRLKDGFLAQENATVAVYNGTIISGLAARTAKDLKSYGYNVNTIADAPTKGVQKTIVVDLRNGAKKYTKRYLENRFGTQVVTTIPDAKINPGDADFVIILGQNEQTRLAN